MKKFLVLGCLFVFAFLASAQGGQGGGGFQMTPEQQAEFQARRDERLKTECKLTDKQLADIKKVEESYTPKMNELRTKFMETQDREKWAADFQKLREEINAKVKPLISAEQYAKYVELNSPTFGQRGQGGGGGGGNR